MEVNKNLFAHRTVADVVADDYRRGAVFKKFGIDFCCGGGKTVEVACTAGGVSYDELEKALLAADAPRGTTFPSDPRGWDLGFMADYIVNVHHSYVRENLPILLQFTGKVARVHGGHRPELIEIAGLVEELADEMDQHMMKEEKVLFPHVKKLVESQRDGVKSERPTFGTVKNPIRAMEHEHDHAGDLMRRIRVLADDFVPPMDACNTYRASFAKLEEFEEDLHRHVHLENNILFPATVKLEEASLT